MSEPSEQPEPTRRQIVAMAVLTVLGSAMFAVSLVSAGSSWQVWLFGTLMVLAAVGFWAGYLLHRRHR